eukprot:4339475-Amphidinium_carterae.1
MQTTKQTKPQKPTNVTVFFTELGPSKSGELLHRRAKGVPEKSGAMTLLLGFMVWNKGTWIVHHAFNKRYITKSKFE